MSLISATQGSEGLTLLHQRLDAHFRALRTTRDEHGGGAPVFALEHGLSEPELALLNEEVRTAVRRGRLPREYGLPFVVYAAEVGYEYCGDEYWPIFESRTPGWATFGDQARQYLRRRFYDFESSFGGARPAGAWAEHFSIICWPITHAVLPTDLQRQLAKLLVDYSRALTSDLLADPAELGLRLAARAWHHSTRFQTFAQNTSLLGQVAAALYLNEDEESPYLLDSTLRRIVASLSIEREAGRWLREARSNANRVRTHGFVRPERRAGDQAPAVASRLPLATDPSLSLSRETGGWSAFLSLPDLSVLGERLPMIHQELGRLRARVAGVSGPLASGRLLFAGQQVRLTEWPEPRSGLIQLDGGSSTVNGLLADQCRLSAGPFWLFRIRERGLAVEVRGKFVRSGEQYILLSRDPLDEGRPAWMGPTACVTAGVHAYHLEIPSPVEPHHLEEFRSLGLGLVADVTVRPAGVVPGGWDGGGAAEWLAGEDAIVAVHCTRALSRCIVTVDGQPHLLAWPDARQEMFISLTDLEIGTHEVHVSLLPSDVDAPVSEGSLVVAVRAPHSRPLGGSFREGLMLLATPANPTLTELWDGRASLQLVGPPGTSTSVNVALCDGKNVTLARRTFRVVLPLDTAGWLNLAARELRGPSETRRVYDDAESLVITASHAGLGTAQLRCDREFAPLRWAVGDDRDGPFIRLIDNTEAGTVEVERLDFATPDRGTQVVMSRDEPLRWQAGGLFRVVAPNFQASVILPPADFESLRAPGLIPTVTRGARTSTEAIRLVRLLALWASASLPANPLAEHERHAVLRAVTAELVSHIAGRRWESMEERGIRSDEFSLSELQELVGEEGYQRELAAAIRERLGEWQAVDPEKRTDGFAAALASNQRRGQIDSQGARVAEFLLRLASDPASLDGWPEDEVRDAIELAIVSPVLVRAARFLVLAIHSLETDEGGSLYRGWAWA